MTTIDLWPGDRVKWRKVEFTIQSTWQDGTVDLWDADNHALIEDVAASELEESVMNKFLEHEDVEPLSEADAKVEYDEWMKQAIMDDKAQ